MIFNIEPAEDGFESGSAAVIEGGSAFGGGDSARVAAAFIGVFFLLGEVREEFIDGF